MQLPPPLLLLLPSLSYAPLPHCKTPLNSNSLYRERHPLSPSFVTAFAKPISVLLYCQTVGDTTRKQI